MTSLYRKKCYFLINDKYYSGRIAGHKKNKYFIDADDENVYRLDYPKNSNGVCININNIYFTNDMEKLIQHETLLYVAETLIDNGLFMLPRLKSLLVLFPENVDLLEMNINFNVLKYLRNQLT